MDHPSTRPLSRAWRRSWLRENAERSRGVGVEWRPVRETRSIGVAAPARSIAAGDRAAARRRRWGSLSPPTRNPLLRPRASRRGRSDGVEVVAVGPSRSDNIPARVDSICLQAGYEIRRSAPSPAFLAHLAGRVGPSSSSRRWARRATRCRRRARIRQATVASAPRSGVALRSLPLSSRPRRARRSAIGRLSRRRPPPR